MAETARASSDRLVVALVRGVHGLRGAVRVEILTDRPEDRYAPGTVLFREGDAAPLTITWSSPIADGPGWRLQFAGVLDRASAEALQGAYLEIAAGPDAVLPRGAYFWHEVIELPHLGSVEVHLVGMWISIVVVSVFTTDFIQRLVRAMTGYERALAERVRLAVGSLRLHGGDLRGGQLLAQCPEPLRHDRLGRLHVYVRILAAHGADFSNALPTSHGRPSFFASPCRSRRVMSRPTA